MSAFRNTVCGWVGATLAAASLAAIAPRAASGSPIFVNNFSFETGISPVDPGDEGTAAAAGWSGSGAVGIYDPTDLEFAGTTGNNVQGTLPNGGQDLVITTYYLPLGGPLGGSLEQTVALVAANTTYTLTVSVGTRLETISGGWSISLLAGVTTIGSNTGNSGPAAGTFIDRVAVAGPFGPLDPKIGSPLIIRISGFNVSGNTTTAQDQFDNVRLDATLVPEPASGMVLLAGAVSMGFTRRRGRAI